MAVLKEINSRDWQVSLAGSGIVAQGVDDVQQCIDVILRTQKGTDPLRPFFGSDIYNYVDTPADIAIPNIKRCIIEALELWEQRISIVSITHKQSEFKLQFFITYKVVDDDLEQIIQLFIGGGSVLTTDVQRGLILEGIFPAGWPGKQLYLSFSLDGHSAAPTPPALGFSSPANMLTWVNANWSNYGKWYLLPDRIVLFMNPGAATLASLKVTILNVFRFGVDIPNLTTGQQLQVQLIAAHPIGGGIIIAANSPLFSNMADMLTWVNIATNFGYLGTWKIENSAVTAGDFDISDFDLNDFNTENIIYQLVLYSVLYDSVTFNVISV